MPASAAPSYHKPASACDLVLCEATYGLPRFVPASPSSDDAYAPPMRYDELTDAQLTCLVTDLKFFFMEVASEVVRMQEAIEAVREART